MLTVIIKPIILMSLMLIVTTKLIMLSVIYADCYNYAHYTECFCTDSRGALKEQPSYVFFR